MRLKTFLILLVPLLVFVAESPAQARPVHWFSCDLCHKAGQSTTSLGGNNVCLQCHKDGHSGTLMIDGSTASPHGLFSTNDASDAMGEASKVLGTVPTEQNSHYWASPKDVVAAAGALAPTAALYRSRYGISNGKVTCTRCHDPHLTKDEDNPEAAANKLLRMNNPDGMCLNCHRPWNISNEAGTHALETHPLVKDYPAFAAANADKYRSVAGYNSATLVLPTNVGQGSIRMVYNSIAADGTGSGTLNLSCTSCHGVHFTDSDSSTADGLGATLNAGDGRILLSDGPRRTDADPAVQGQLRSNLCQTCHVYKKHGDADSNDNGTFAGCLDCHGGHVYDVTAPNYFILRKTVPDVFVPKSGTVTNALGLNFSTAAGDWANAEATGYCQGCHTLTFPHNGKGSGSHGREDCIYCHAHNNTTASFFANCNGCHGCPPVLNTEGTGTSGGYAVDVDNNRSYRYSNISNLTLRAEFKDESKTPHKRHAAGETDYSLGCDGCHSEAFSGAQTHLNGDFQDVDFSAMVGVSATYDASGAGICSNIYCHSNGNSDSPVYSVVTWRDTAGTIDNCTACHGNNATTMNDANKRNSTSHRKHLGQGDLGVNYGCNVCHHDTAVDGDTLIASAKAAGGVHVNGQADVAFIASGGALYNALAVGSFNAEANTCSTVYCHSDGQGHYASPDWDVAASGACGTCHGAAPTSGSHTAHIDPAGANIGCDTCHGAGAATGTHNGHIDAEITVTEGICDACHAVDVADGSTTPVWGDSASAVCDACHAGTQVTDYTDASNQVRTAPAKTDYFSAGHGKTVATGGATPPNIGCIGCHSTAPDAAHMGAGSTDRLRTITGQTYAAGSPNGFCGACHDGGSGNEKQHFATSGLSSDGSVCTACHDPHGVSGYDAMLLGSIQGHPLGSFTDRSLRASYAKDTTFTGVCQVCHAADEVRRFNQSTYSADHGGTRNCIECHPHTADTAFAPVCYSCHGGGTTVGAEKNYWPDDTTVAAENSAGKHIVHMEKLAMAVYGEQYNTTLLTTTANGTADTKQKALCEFCHAAVVNDDDHTVAGNAEVFVAPINGVATRFAKPIWDINTTDPNAAYDAANDTCANVACHKNKLTADGTYGWYDAGTTACIMCHNDITKTTLATGKVHSQHVNAGSTFGIAITCTSCHESGTAWGTPGTKPSSGHLDGSFVVARVGSFPRFTYTGNWAMGGSFGTCGTNDCHNDGKDETPYSGNKGGYLWGGDVGFGCVVCHMYTGITSNGHNAHSTTTISSISCSRCHSGSGMDSLHINRVVNLKSTMNYNSATYNSTQLTTVSSSNYFGRCNTTVCHQDGSGNLTPTPLWNESATDTCTLCHASQSLNGSPHPSLP